MMQILFFKKESVCIICYIFLFCLATQICFAQIPCAVSERLQKTDFFDFGNPGDGGVSIASINQYGWAGSGNGSIGGYTNRTWLTDDYYTQSLTQSITNANLKGNGAVVSIDVLPNNGIGGSSKVSVLDIIYDGVAYATISTSAGYGYTTTVTYKSGASGNYTIITGVPSVSPTAYQRFVLEIYLPATINNNGPLQIRFDPEGSSIGDSSDDFVVYSVSFKACPIIYSGIVYDDANGITNNLIDGIGTSLSGTLSIGLFDNSNNLLASTSVNPDGTFILAYAGSGSYTARLLNLTNSYVNTGEKLNTDPATGDGLPDGISNAIIIANSNNNTDRSLVFGIDGLPSGYNVSSYFTGVPAFAILSGNPFQGRDAEDMPSQGTWAGKSFVVTSLPDNGFILKYAGSIVILNMVIDHYIPELLTIEPGIGTPAGITTTNFQYAVIDAANKQSLTSSAYTVTWNQLLPAQVLNFYINNIGNTRFLLRWQVTNQNNFSYYEVERSFEEKSHFQMLGRVKSNGEINGQYSFSDNTSPAMTSVIYYRLKMVDMDGSISYSQIQSVKTFNNSGAVRVAGNVVNVGERITILTGRDSRKMNVLIQLYNTGGVLVRSVSIKSGISCSIETNNLSRGIYILRINEEEQVSSTKVVIK
ncbi:MAG: T9SS type A sorting domain-containing protein [Agriterribacter sp.]